MLFFSPFEKLKKETKEANLKCPFFIIPTIGKDQASTTKVS